MKTIEKVDFKKTLKHLYAPKKGAFQVVEVPEMQFLMVDGQGDPNTAQSYADAIQALYAVAYGLKFSCKTQLEKDFVVAPLEGLWWADSPDAFHRQLDKDSWKWTAMIHMPEWCYCARMTCKRSARNVKTVITIRKKCKIMKFTGVSALIVLTATCRG